MLYIHFLTNIYVYTIITRHQEIITKIQALDIETSHYIQYTKILEQT